MTRAELVQAFKASALVHSDTVQTHLGNDLQVIDATMTEVLAEFSRDVRRVKVHTFTWDGVSESLPLWYEDSVSISLEAPTGLHPRSYVDPSYIEIDQLTGALYLTLTSTGTDCEARYSIMHELPSTGEVTIPEPRRKAFFYLVAAALCEKIASKHAESNRGNIADVVDYQTKSREYLGMAKAFRAQYRQIVGTPAEPVQAAGEVSVEYEYPSYRIGLERRAY